MSVRQVIHKLAQGAGLSDDEISELDDLLEDGDSFQVPEIDLSDEIPGRAEAALEVFTSDTGPALESAQGEILWYPMIREGQWAVRPGPRGQKKRKPLRVVAGKSKDQRKEIGLEDLKSAFEDGAVEYVTVPETHSNNTLENTGFIRGMKIAKAPVASGPNKGKKVATLFGGYHFTDQKAKQKVKEGSVAGRSCGILYDYVNTETGKQYPAVVEHVCLTNKPWITGMIPFGRKLSGVEGLSVEPMRLSDNSPSDEILSDPDAFAEWAEQEAEELAQGDEVWQDEGSANWVRGRVENSLRIMRDQHRNARRAALPANAYVDVGDDFPYWRVDNVRTTSQTAGEVLICDGYGDGRQYWVAPYKVVDGDVELQQLTDWKKVKTVMVEDDSGPSAAEEEAGVSEDGTAAPVAAKTASNYDTSTPRGRLALAQSRRRARTSTSDNGGRPTADPDPTTHPRGGEQQHMAGESNGNSSALQLSEEAQRAVNEANERARKAEEESQRLSQRVDRLTGSVQGGEVDQFIGRLKGMGFSEEAGFGGMLVELRNVLLADDHEVAVVSEKFSESGSDEVELSLTQAFERVFGAIKVGDDGKIKLGEQLTEASDTSEEDGEGGDAENASRDGEGGDGKPPKSETKDELSAKEKADKLAEENPAIAAVVGPPSNGGGES